MANEDYLEVGLGGSCPLLVCFGVLDQQWLGASVSPLAGSIPPFLHVSNRWTWTLPRGEVFGLSVSPRPLAPVPTGS